MGMKLPLIAGPKIEGDFDTAMFHAVKDCNCEVCGDRASVVVIRDTVTKTPANAVPLCNGHAGMSD
jgi:hypothetical protein